MNHHHNQNQNKEPLDKSNFEAFNKQIKQLQLQYPREFSLCLNLSCGINNNSIQHPLQIPPEMLSQSIDFLPGLNRPFSNYSQQMNQCEQQQQRLKIQSQSSQNKEQIQKVIVKQQVKQQNFYDMAGSSQNDLLGLAFEMNAEAKEYKKNTKNVLRNFGNAQNQFILYNETGKKRAEEYISDDCLQQFQQWVRVLKLLNFRDYRNVWGQSKKDSKKIGAFKKIYKRLCWQFYETFCIPYIYSGRLNASNRFTHLKQVQLMLKGLQSPQDFHSFHN